MQEDITVAVDPTAGVERRSVFGGMGAGAVAIGALAAGGLVASSAPASAQTIADTDILNFALNL